MKLQRFSGYSDQQFNSIFGNAKCHLLIGSGVQFKQKYDNNTEKYINEVDSAEVEVYFEKMGVQSIKLPKSFKLNPAIQDMAIVELIQPEACCIGLNVYVKAKGIREI